MGDGLAADGTPGDDATSDGAAMRDGTVTEGAMDSGAADVFEEAPAHCSGDFQCIPAVPGGWAGPTDLYLGAAPAPTCPGLTTDSFDGMEGLQATAASCDCACGPTKITCGSASLTTSIVAGCATVCATTTPVLGACFAAPSGCLAVGATGTFQTLAVAVTGGSCAPVSTAEITPPTWTNYARTCASLGSAQADCPAGQICARTPSAPFQPTACIVQAGDQMCPAKGYTQAHAEFTGLIDTRACTACTCGAPAKLQCTGTLYAYDTTTDGTCGGMADIYDPAACVPTNERSDLKVDAVGSGGACAASVVTPMGAVTPTGATTICCTE
jgi:hypothetical protein